MGGVLVAALGLGFASLHHQQLPHKPSLQEGTAGAPTSASQSPSWQRLGPLCSLSTVSPVLPHQPYLDPFSASLSNLWGLLDMPAPPDCLSLPRFILTPRTSPEIAKSSYEATSGRGGFTPVARSQVLETASLSPQPAPRFLRERPSLP